MLVAGASRNFGPSRESLLGSPQNSAEACVSFVQALLCYPWYPNTASRIPVYLSA